MGLTTNSPDSAHLPPNSPDKLCASPRATPTATENSRGPATSRPHCPVRVPGRRSQVGVASLCPNHRQGARVVEAAPNRAGPTPPPQTAFTCLHGPVGALEFRTERLSSAAAAEPRFPKELIPVAGGGGAEGRSPRRRKGREVSAAIPARESAPERTEPEKKDSHLSPGLSRGRGAEERRPGRMAEVGGEGPPAATLSAAPRGPEPGGQAAERTGAQQPALCLRPLSPLGKEKLGRTFTGRENPSGRKRKQQGEEGGRGRASGRGRSRRQRPRFPHPRARLRGAGGREAEGARGARGARPGAGGMRPGGRARGGGAPCGDARGERGNVEPQLPS